MYLVGKVRATQGGLVAWDPIKVVFFRRSAVKACTTKKHFYFEKVKSGKEITGTPIYPLVGEQG